MRIGIIDIFSEFIEISGVREPCFNPDSLRGHQAFGSRRTPIWLFNEGIMDVQIRRALLTCDSNPNNSSDYLIAGGSLMMGLWHIRYSCYLRS